MLRLLLPLQWLLIAALALPAVAQHPPKPARKARKAERREARHETRKQRGLATESFTTIGVAPGWAVMQDLRAQAGTQAGPGLRLQLGYAEAYKKRYETLLATGGAYALVPAHGASQTLGVVVQGAYTRLRWLRTWRGLRLYAGGQLAAGNNFRVNVAQNNSALSNEIMAGLNVAARAAGQVHVWRRIRPEVDGMVALPVATWVGRVPRYSLALIEPLMGHRVGPLGVVTPLHTELGLYLRVSRWHRDRNPNRIRVAYAWDMYHVADALHPLTFATHSLSFSWHIARGLGASAASPKP